MIFALRFRNVARRCYHIAGHDSKLTELGPALRACFPRDLAVLAEPTSVNALVYDPDGMTVGRARKSFPTRGTAGIGRARCYLRPFQLYVTVGSGSNISLGEDPVRAALHKYNPDGSGHETFATGLRNIIGLRFHPGSSEIWAAVQERDGLGDDLANDFLVNVKKGEFYGWPYAYNGRIRTAPRRAGADMVGPRRSIRRSCSEPTLPCLISTFYTGRSFRKYRGGLFMASTDQEPVGAYRLQRYLHPVQAGVRSLARRFHDRWIARRGQIRLGPSVGAPAQGRLYVGQR